MSGRSKLAVVAIAALVVAALTVGLLRDEAPAAAAVALDGTERLPKVSGPDLVGGERRDLADYRGKPLVINAWASWCGPCRDEAPALKEFAESNPQIAVVGLNVNNDRGDAREFNEKAGWTYPSIYDPDGKLALSTLEIQQLPSTLYVDSAGVIRGRTSGPVTLAVLNDVAKRLR